MSVSASFNEEKEEKKIDFSKSTYTKPMGFILYNTILYVTHTIRWSIEFTISIPLIFIKVYMYMYDNEGVYTNTLNSFLVV